MYCRNCGKAIEESGKFCSYCGTPYEVIDNNSYTPNVEQPNYQNNPYSKMESSPTETTPSNEGTKNEGTKKNNKNTIFIIIFMIFTGISLFRIVRDIFDDNSNDKYNNYLYKEWKCVPTSSVSIDPTDPNRNMIIFYQEKLIFNEDGTYQWGDYTGFSNNHQQGTYTITYTGTDNYFHNYDIALNVNSSIINGNKNEYTSTRTTHYKVQLNKNLYVKENSDLITEMTLVGQEVSSTSLYCRADRY